MAINQIDRDLNDRLMSYANTIAKGDRTLEQTLRQHAKSLGGVQEDVVSEYEEYLNKSRTWHGKEAEAAKDRLIRMRRLEQDAEKAQAEGNDAKVKYNRDMNKLCAQEKKLRDDLNALSNTSGNNLRKASLNDQIARVKAQRLNSAEEWKAANKERAARIDLGAIAARERRAFENKELAASAKWGNAFRATLSNVGQSALTKAFGELSIGAGMEKIATSIYTAVKEGAKHGTGLSINPFDDSAIGIFGAAKHGFDTKDWMNTINSPDTQKAIRSSQRGMYDFAAGLDLADRQLSKSVISARDRSAIAIKNMELMSSSGVRARAQDSVAFSADMERTRKLTGDSYEDFQKNIGEILQDENVRAQLKAATSEQERRAILDGVSAQYAQNRAMGMTTSEAKNAAKALSKLAGEKPLDRFKKAARIRAFGAAMGMGGEANAAADIYLKGKRASADEQAQLKATLGHMSEALVQTGTGDIGAEIFATQLADKLQLEELLGPSSSFNTTLAAATAPLKDASETFSQVPDKLAEVFAAAEQAFQAMTKNDLVSGLVAGAAGAFLLKNGVGIAKGLMGMGGAEAGAGAAGAGLGVLGSTAAVAGAGVVGYGIGTAIDKGSEHLAKGTKYEGAGTEHIGGTLAKVMSFFGSKDAAEAVAKVDQANRALAEMNSPKPNAAVKPKDQPQPDQQPPAAAVKPADKANLTPPPLRGQTNEADTAKREEEKHVAVTSTAQSSREHTKKLDASNDLLQQIAETTQRQVELSEKQLIAMTMSENERMDSANRGNLRKDNKFGAQYGYA